MGFNGRFHFAAVGISAAIILALASTATADEITIGTIPYPNIRILGISDNSLEYFTNGQRQTVELSRVSVVGLSKYPAFAEAIKQIESDPSTAADQLRGVLADLKEDYLRPLVASRLVAALDNAGQFAAAAEQYVELLKQSPNSFFTLSAPSKLPTDAAQLKAAEKTLAAALPSIRGQVQHQLVEALLTKVRQATPAPAATDTPAAAADDATAATPAAAAPAAPSAVQEVEKAPEAEFISMSGIENLMRAKKYQEAADLANKMMDRPNAQLPDLFYQRALAEQAMGEDDRAAMSFLRVAIHFPDHQLAVPAMYQAGQELAKAGDAAAAARVYAAALQKTTDASTRQQIQRALDGLPADAKK